MSDDPDKPDQPHEAVWVSSKFTPDGTYILAIEFSLDVALPLNTDQARAYSAEVLRATVIAQYDAAILRQLTETLHATTKDAALAVRMLRDDRPELDKTALGPLCITPSVSAITGKPYLACTVAVPRGRTGPYDRDGQRRWHWTIAEGRQHARHVLEESNLIDLDLAYRRWLIAHCDVDEAHALHVVRDLGTFFAAHG